MQSLYYNTKFRYKSFAGSQPHYYNTNYEYNTTQFPTRKELAAGTHVLTLATGTDDYHQEKGPSVLYTKLEMPYGEMCTKPKACSKPPIEPAAKRLFKRQRTDKEVVDQ